MDFIDFSIENAQRIIPYLQKSDELSCETSFVNFIIWQPYYKNRVCIDDDVLFVSSNAWKEPFFALPFGNVKKGMEMLCDYVGGLPVIWAQQGERFDEFCRIYGDKYEIIESRDDFDYLYEAQSLATLSGKKYHSKRNHISAFSRSYDWHYEDIDEGNIPFILECAEKWYKQNADSLDERLNCEKISLPVLLANRELLNVKGGAIFVEGSVVAFALGSPLNDKVFDVHVEKALEPFSAAYSVINREFAKRIAENYQYINREDDLGLEGLRRSKLSYNPITLVKKYICKPR